MDLLDQYVEKFGENFPIFGFNEDNKTLEEAIKECLEKGEPYKAEYKEGCVY